MKYQIFRIYKGGSEEFAKEFDTFEQADSWKDKMESLPYMDLEFEIREKEAE